MFLLKVLNNMLSIIVFEKIVVLKKKKIIRKVDNRVTQFLFLF